MITNRTLEDVLTTPNSVTAISGSVELTLLLAHLELVA